MSLMPLLRTGDPLGYWLRVEGTCVKARGCLAGVGRAYCVKVLGGPVVVRRVLPLLGRLGRRRGWMALSQIVIAIGLIGMALVGPGGGLTAAAALALVTAFASATQDIAVDAWRIEASDDSDEMGLLSSASQLGYRVALLVTDALIISLAGHFGWPNSYLVMAVFMAIGLAATILTFEPAQADAVMQGKGSLWPERKSVVKGKSVSVRVDLGGRRIIQKNKH